MAEMAMNLSCVIFVYDLSHPIKFKRNTKINKYFIGAYAQSSK